jgi:hypothetical protein
LRWNLEPASREFNLSIPTIRAGLTKNSITRGADGCYSTVQICEALYGALHLEKIRTQRQLTRRYELDNAIVESSVINKAALMSALAQLADAMTSRVMAHTELPREVREDFLRDLSSIPVILDDVAKRQSKLPRSNEQRDDVDEDE